MRLKFLGCGAAFTVASDNFQSNLLLEDDFGKRLLIDCGSDVRWSLHAAGLSHRDISHVYVSHLHADHVGGLEWLALSTKFDAACVKPVLYISETMMDDLWNHVLSGGLRSLDQVEASLDAFFKVECIPLGAAFSWGGLELTLVSNIHYTSNGVVMPTYGLFFEIGGVKIWITADTQFTPDLLGYYYQSADLIFHDCETEPDPTGVHAHYHQLTTLPASIKGKMWLYHYNQGVLPDAVGAGFRGFVFKGQVFEFEQNR